MVAGSGGYEILGAIGEANRHLHVVGVDLVKVDIEAALTSLRACEQRISLCGGGSKAGHGESKHDTGESLDVHRS
jgi:hypothetical protein